MSCHILVVDEHRGLRQALHVILEDQGYRVTTAADGRQALDVVEVDPPDLLLLDIGMYVASGTELREHLLARSIMVPLVVMSRDPDSVALPTAHHADAYLAKPFDLTSLLATVARVAPCPGA